MGIPNALYLAALNGDGARPTILEMPDWLAKDIGVPYKKAMLYAAYAQ